MSQNNCGIVLKSPIMSGSRKRTRPAADVPLMVDMAQRQQSIKRRNRRDATEEELEDDLHQSLVEQWDHAVPNTFPSVAEMLATGRGLSAKLTAIFENDDLPFDANQAMHTIFKPFNRSSNWSRTKVALEEQQKQAFEELVQERDDLLSEVSGLKRFIIRKRDFVVETLLANFKTSRDTADRLEDEKKALEVRSNALQEENALLRASVTRLETENEKFRTDALPEGTALLRAKVTHLESENLRLTGLLESKIQTARNLSRTYKEKAKRLKRKMAIVTAAKIRLEALRKHAF